MLQVSCTIGVHGNRGLGGGGGGGGEKIIEKTTTQSIEPERPLDEGTA